MPSAKVTANAASPISLPTTNEPTEPAVQLPVAVKDSVVAAAAAAPQSPPAIAVEPQAPVAKRVFDSLYLSDKELIQAQSFLDDGEVEE